MKSILSLTLFTAAVVNAVPVQRRAVQESNLQAAQNWQKDTGIVSAFLDKAASLSGTEFMSEAAYALAAELDELNHKAVLDADPTISASQAVASASNVLATQGAFNLVVQRLQDQVTKGDSTRVTETNLIDSGRCKDVLPNIDVYLKAGGLTGGAVRPAACDLTGQVSQVVAGGGTTSGTGASTGTGSAAGSTTTGGAKAGGTGTGTGTGKAGGSTTGGSTTGGSTTGGSTTGGSTTGGSTTGGSTTGGSATGGSTSTGKAGSSGTGNTNAGTGNTNAGTGNTNAGTGNTNAGTGSNNAGTGSTSAGKGANAAAAGSGANRDGGRGFRGGQ